LGNVVPTGAYFDTTLDAIDAYRSGVESGEEPSDGDADR
jgi:hypothetical protein